MQRSKLTSEFRDYQADYKVEIRGDAMYRRELGRTKVVIAEIAQRHSYKNIESFRGRLQIPQNILI